MSIISFLKKKTTSKISDGEAFYAASGMRPMAVIALELINEELQKAPRSKRAAILKFREDIIATQQRRENHHVNR